MAWTLVVPIEAHVRFLLLLLRDGALISSFAGRFPFLRGHSVVLCLSEPQLVQPSTFRAFPVKHWLKYVESMADQSSYKQSLESLMLVKQG